MEKFEEKVEEIKEQIHNIDLSEDVKEKLEINLKIEYNKNDKKDKNSKKFKTYTFSKVAAVFICILVVSGCVFADCFENIIANIFSNFDQNANIAIENDNIIPVDSEYQEYNGVSIKVDYVSLNDKNLYIALNIKTEDEVKRINLDNIKIEDENQNLIYDNENKSNFKNVLYKYQIKRNDTKSAIILTDFIKNDGKIEIKDKIKININEIKLKKDNKYETINGNWNFEIYLKNEG